MKLFRKSFVGFRDQLGSTSLLYFKDCIVIFYDRDRSHVYRRVQ
jgi:hypothetical protein